MIEENGIKKIDLMELAAAAYRALRRFWLPLLLITAAGALVTTLYAYATFVPYYESQATLTVNTSDSALIVGTGDTQVKESLPYILSSQYMKNLVMDDLSLTHFPAEVRLESKSLANFFILTVRAQDAETANRILVSVIENCPRASIYVLGKISFELLDTTGVVEQPVNMLNPLRKACIGGLVSFALSCAILVLYMMTRRTIVVEEDLKSSLSIGCLASLPLITFKKRRKKIETSVHIKNEMVGGSFHEMVRTMRSRVQRAAEREGRKVILVSSSVPSEGKTTVASNLALSLAEKNEKVVLVDLDLRSPSVYEVLGIAAQPEDSIDTVLKRKKEWQEALCRKPEWNLDLLGGGLPQTNPVSLLNTRRFVEVINDLRAAYDYVILDTPPAAMMSDAAAIARHADAAIYVVKQDHARMERIAEGMDALGMSRVPILGVVLNCVQSVSGRYGGYRSYYSGYGRYGRYGRYGAYGHYGSREKEQNEEQESQDFIDLSNPWEK